jgi:putative transposase
VFANASTGGALYLDDFDRVAFLERLGSTCLRFEWICSAYCLMGTHYHLALRTPHPNVAAGMRILNGAYAERFNRRYDRRGHVFQARYGDRLARHDSQVVEIARYVVLNPVRAGLVERPEEWPWSSYRSTAGLTPSPPWLDTSGILAHFGSDEEVARRAYRAFVAEGMSIPDMSGDLVPGQV